MVMAKKKIYRFKGTEGASMSETVVRKWIQSHQDHHEVKGHFYGKEILTKLLGYPGCVGIRIYHAIDDNNKKQLVLVGADEKGNDLWPSTVAAKKGKLKGGDGPITIDQAMPCPPYCPGK
jgi:hypothetical protein